MQILVYKYVITTRLFGFHHQLLKKKKFISVTKGATFYVGPKRKFWFNLAFFAFLAHSSEMLEFFGRWQCRDIYIDTSEQ